MPWGLPNVLDYSWEPPGVPSNPDDINVVPNGDGTANIYMSGERAPAGANTFSYPGTSRGMGAGIGGPPPVVAGETATERQERFLKEWADRIADENRSYRDYLAGESARRFGIMEQRLSAADRAAGARAQAQTAATEAGTRAQQLTAGQRLAFDRQQAADRLAFERQALGQTTADRERSQRVALAQALLSLSTGPNGPANRRMALDLLAGLGVNTAGGQDGGPAQSPNSIPPALWDALPPGGKKLLTDAWEAQGGNPGDFQFAINQQRPQGAAAPAQVRYAAPAGA